MDRPTICNTCLEEENIETPCKGFIEGEPYCTKHLTALDGVAKHYGLTVAETEEESIRKSAVKNLPRVIPPLNDANSLTAMLGEVIQGVLDGSYSVKRANAVCNLSQMAIKSVELEWKMKRSKEISYIVKKLEE